MQYTSFAKDLPSFAEESPSFTEELPSFVEYFFLGRLGHRVFTGYSVAVFPTLMLTNLLQFTYLQKETVHLHVLESFTQTVVIGSATNATKEAVTRTIYTCLTCSGGNYNQCTACNSSSILYPNTGAKRINPCPNGFWGDTSTNTCRPCYSSGSGPYYTCTT
jgi:hypothetical protein